MILIIVLPTLGFSGSAGHSIGTQASFGPEKLKSAKPVIIFIGPEYDHRLPLSITDSWSVDLIDVALAVEDSNSKLFRSARASWNTSVRPLVSPSVRKKKLDHIYTGIYASRII